MSLVGGMRNAHGALYACQKLGTVPQNPVPGNTKNPNRGGNSGWRWC